MVFKPPEQAKTTFDRSDGVSALTPAKTTSGFKDVNEIGLKTREELMASLGVTSQAPTAPPVIKIDWRPEQDFEAKPLPIYVPPEREKGGGGFKGLLGSIIGVIDTPRAAIVSTIKETGDLIQGEGFDVSDWWTQTSDNMMMGEVLRDWNVDLPGPLDFVVGLGLDIALDPLTYLAAGSLSARFANPARIADALGEAAKIQKLAGNTSKATMLTKAQGNVLAKKSILSAGDEALKEIGMNVGLRFTLPGTGRLGRTIIERPLRAFSKRIGKKLDAKRISQLPEASLPGKANPWARNGERAFDYSKPGNVKNLQTKMNSLRANKLSPRTAMTDAAQRAARMPVELFKIPGTANFVRVTAGAAGTAFAAGAATKAGKYIGDALGTQGPWNRAIRTLGKRMAVGDEEATNIYNTLRLFQKGADQATIKVGTWQHKLLEDVKDIREIADKAGVKFDELITEAAETPFFVDDLVNGGQKFNDELRRFGITENMEEFHKQASGFWKNAGFKLQEDLASVGIQMDLLDFADELYVPRFINRGVAADYVDDVHGPESLTIDGFNKPSTGGNSFGKGRQYVTPKVLKNLREPANRSASVAGGVTVAQPTAITNQMIINAAKKAKIRTPAELKKMENFSTEQLNVVFDELLGMPQGVQFVYLKNGKKTKHFISNRFMGGRIKDLEESKKSVRQQMQDIGERQLGKGYENLYETDPLEIMTRYINQGSQHLRENIMLGVLDNAGITIRLSGGKEALGASSSALIKNANKRLRSLNKTLGSKARKLEKAERQLKFHADLLESFEDATGPFSLGGAEDVVRNGSKEAYINAVSAVEEAKAQVDEIERLIGAFDNPEILDLEGLNISRAVFELISPPTVNPTKSEKLFTKALIDRGSYLNDANDAALFVANIAETMNKLPQVRMAIKAVLDDLDPNTASKTKKEFMKLLTILDDAIEMGEEATRNLSQNWLAKMDLDPSVQFAKAYNALADSVTNPQSAKQFKITRNGRTLSQRTFIQPAEKELRHLIVRVKRAAVKAGGDSTVEGRKLLKEAKTQEKWLNHVSELNKLDRSLGTSRLYSGTMRALRTVDDGRLLIDDISGLAFINEEIARINVLIANAGKGVDDLDQQSQKILQTLKNRKQVLEDGNVAVHGRMRQVIEESNASKQQRQILYDRRKITVDTLREDIATIEKNKEDLINGVKLEIDMGQRNYGPKQGTLSSKRSWSGTVKEITTDAGFVEELKYIEETQAAMQQMKNVRASNSLSDAYGGALNDYVVQHTKITTIDSSGDLRNAFMDQPQIGGARKYERVKPKFDDLAFVGKYTDEDMELMTSAMLAMGKMQDPLEVSEFMGTYNKFLNYWKAQAVSTPGFFMRNMMGGIWINNQIQGVPMSVHARVREIRKLAVAAGDGNPIKGLTAMIENGKSVQLKGAISALGGNKAVSIDELRVFKSWFDTGVAGQGQVSQEITTAVDKLGQGGRAGAFAQGSKNPFDASFKPFNWVRARNSDTEFILRGSLAHHIRMGGGSVEDAWGAVRKYHFDYGDLSNFEKKIKKVIPFWTWQRNILPVLIESIGKQPRIWGRLQQVKEELELNSPMEGLVPHYFAGNMGIRMPFKIDGNRTYMLPDFPFRDLQKITKQMGDEGDPLYERALDIKGLVKGAGRLGVESALPPVKLPIELMLGKQFFGSIPFTGRYQQAPRLYNTPVIKNIVLSLGLAKKAKNGRLVMTDKDIYSLDQFAPVFGRVRRMFPNEKSKQDALITTWLNTVMGTGLRVNTPRNKRSALIRKQREFAEEMQQILDIERRTR